MNWRTAKLWSTATQIATVNVFSSVACKFAKFCILGINKSTKWKIMLKFFVSLSWNKGSLVANYRRPFARLIIPPDTYAQTKHLPAKQEISPQMRSLSKQETTDGTVLHKSSPDVKAFCKPAYNIYNKLPFALRFFGLYKKPPPVGYCG